jgi:hypothetical protein
MKTRVPEVYDHLLSIGALVDMLSIENIKCYDANNKLYVEQLKDDPDLALISKLEQTERAAGEQRCRLKAELTARIDEAIRRGGVAVSVEARTYSTARKPA